MYPGDRHGAGQGVCRERRPGTPPSALPASGRHHTRLRRPGRGSGRHAEPGEPVGVKQDAVIEGEVAHPALRPHRPPPRRLAHRAGEGGGGVVARHRVSTAAPRPRTWDRHGQTWFRRSKPGTREVFCSLGAGTWSVQRARHGENLEQAPQLPTVLDPPWAGASRCTPRHPRHARHQTTVISASLTSIGASVPSEQFKIKCWVDATQPARVGRQRGPAPRSG